MAGILKTEEGSAGWGLQGGGEAQTSVILEWGPHILASVRCEELVLLRGKVPPGTSWVPCPSQQPLTSSSVQRATIEGGKEQAAVGR